MKIQKKQLSAVIAFALTLTIAATFISALPAVSAVPATKIKNIAYIYAEPNPVGIGQAIYILGILTPAPKRNEKGSKRGRIVSALNPFAGLMA